MPEGVKTGTAAIILAAGSSSRLGEPKQLLRIDGQTLLRRTVRLALESGCEPVLAVLGFEHERMRTEVADLSLVPVFNRGWEEGMGCSLRSGLGALLRISPETAATAVLVCDQPGLTAEHLRTLLSRHARNGSSITASFYAGGPRVPAIFSAELFAELSRIEGDRGAREVIRQHLPHVDCVHWPAGELDIDEPQDLERLRALRS